MNDKFTYTTPELYRDKLNKKWCVRYKITYEGQASDYPKEYGKTYFPEKNLNAIKNLKEREKEFNKLLILVERDLKNGIDPKRPNKLKAIREQEIKDANRFSYDECVNLYMQISGYNNPVQKKENSAVVMKAFFNNQFGGFVKSKGLEKDINLITKSHIIEYLNIKFLEGKWNSVTFNNKKGILYGFFDLMKDEEKVRENPVSSIRSKKEKIEKERRFEVFTEQERLLVWDWLKKHNPFTLAVSKVMYYAYIRGSELSRLQVSHFDLNKQLIRIPANAAKGQTDNMTRFVRMTDELKEALQDYLKDYTGDGSDYIFSETYKPGKKRMMGKYNERGFGYCLSELRKEHTKLFKGSLSLYCMKHTGVTDFVHRNLSNPNVTPGQIFNYIKEQCRHKDFSTTEMYLQGLEISLDAQDAYQFI